MDWFLYDNGLRHERFKKDSFSGKLPDVPQNLLKLLMHLLRLTYLTFISQFRVFLFFSSGSSLSFFNHLFGCLKADFSPLISRHLMHSIFINHCSQLDLNERLLGISSLDWVFGSERTGGSQIRNLPVLKRRTISLCHSSLPLL